MGAHRKVIPLAGDQVAREVSEAIFDLLREHVFPWYKSVVQEFELSPIQAKTLKSMYDRHIGNMSELAGAVSCPPSHLTGVIAKLEGMRLVERRAGSGDRRVKRVSLTEKGEALCRKLEARLLEPPPWLEGLSAADMRTFRDLLRKIAR
jgi:DNA-binding MarR family transcriptional regulator